MSTRPKIDEEFKDRLFAETIGSNAPKNENEREILIKRLNAEANARFLDALLPYDNPDSENRQKLRAKTPPPTLAGTVKIKEGVIINGKKVIRTRTKSGAVGEEGAKKIREALDLIGRIADNLGVEPSVWDAVYIHPELTARAFFMPVKITDKIKGGKAFKDEKFLKKDIAAKSVVLSIKDAPEDYFKTTAHEFGHAFDCVVPGLMDAVIDHYVDITTEKKGVRKGERTRLCRMRAGATEYYREIAKPLDPNEPVYFARDNYTVRSYRRTNDAEEREFTTELTSMLFQDIATDLLELEHKENVRFYAMLEIYRNNAKKRGVLPVALSKANLK